MVREYGAALAVMVVGLAARQYALVTSTAALLVAIYALLKARESIKTVEKDVMPVLRDIIGEPPPAVKADWWRWPWTWLEGRTRWQVAGLIVIVSAGLALQVVLAVLR